jgi:hypothetical protein
MKALFIHNKRETLTLMKVIVMQAVFPRKPFKKPQMAYQKYRITNQNLLHYFILY